MYAAINYSDKEIVKGRTLPELPIMVGCNYHTTWQSNKQMRFVLAEVNGNQVRLLTRTTRRSFWTSMDTLIFIDTATNIEKYFKLLDGVENSLKYVDKYDRCL